MILMEFYFHFYQCVGLRMGVQTPRKLVTGSYELSYWVLGTHCWSSVRAELVQKHLALSPAPREMFLMSSL